MARDISKLISFLIVVLIISNSRLCESRILRLSESSKSVAKRIGIFIDELYIEGIKTGGPSAGGEGHGFKNAETLGEGKVGGPSAGGAGHKFPTAEILGGRKSGGPSAGGVGHGTKNSQVFQTRPQSGPSPGEGH